MMPINTSRQSINPFNKPEPKHLKDTDTNPTPKPNLTPNQPPNPGTSIRLNLNPLPGININPNLNPLPVINTNLNPNRHPVINPNQNPITNPLKRKKRVILLTLPIPRRVRDHIIAGPLIQVPVPGEKQHPIQALTNPVQVHRINRGPVLRTNPIPNLNPLINHPTVHHPNHQAQNHPINRRVRPVAAVPRVHLPGVAVLHHQKAHRQRVIKRNNYNH
jgi:hypothetical protein